MEQYIVHSATCGTNPQVEQLVRNPQVDVFADFNFWYINNNNVIHKKNKKRVMDEEKVGPVGVRKIASYEVVHACACAHYSFILQVEKKTLRRST